MAQAQFQTALEGQDFVVAIENSFTHRDYHGFVRVLDEVLASGAERLVIDLANIAMIDSDGVGLLLMAFDIVRRRDVAVKVRNATGRVRTVLEVSCVHELFEVA